MIRLDDIFEMHGGYVLNFSNDIFGQFFSELGIDINASEYSQDGGSKGKRLRCFLPRADKATLARALEMLCTYREVVRRRSGQAKSEPVLTSRSHAPLATLSLLHYRHHRLGKLRNAPDAQEFNVGCAGLRAGFLCAHRAHHLR